VRPSAFSFFCFRHREDGFLTTHVNCKWLALFGYRLLLHPLRAYPGPFLAKLTNGYAGFFAMGQRLHLATQRDHRKYGKLIHDPIIKATYVVPLLNADQAVLYDQLPTGSYSIQQKHCTVKKLPYSEFPGILIGHRHLRQR
jgi:hypothetical protein